MKRWHWVFGSMVLMAAILYSSVPKGNFSDLDAKAVALPEAYIPSGSIALENLPEGTVANRAAYTDFKARYGPGWSIFINPNNGKPSYIGGQGLPMIPGRGNTLTSLQVFDDPNRKATVEDVDRLVRKFLAENVELFGLRDADLTLMKESGFYGDSNYLCFLNYQISHQGVPVEGAIFQARLNNGNLVDMGIIGHYAEPAISPTAAISQSRSMMALEEHIGGLSTRDKLVNPGDLKYIPIFLGGQALMGKRIGHRLVWEIEFTRDSVTGQWRAWVDAHTGKLLKFSDVLRYDTYKRIHGQVYPDHLGGLPLADQAFPFVREDTNGRFTASNGMYPYPGGDATCSLNSAVHPSTSTLIWIDEQCATTPALTCADGDLDWGGTAEQDCHYTGAEFGNATEAALMSLYHGTQIKLNALSYLPSNTWLPNSLKIRPNYDATCNATGGGDTITLHRGKAGECNNYGLFPDIISHEIGHSLDTNDGLRALDAGSGEVYGDIAGLIYSHESCLGHLASLTGCVREMDYTQKGDGDTPSTPQNFICSNCGKDSAMDPCGRECHCAAEGMDEAMLDLAIRDLRNISGMDAATAWEYFTRIFYLSRPISGQMYDCSIASICEDWLSSGCSADNWYRTLRAADDDNGNLCDATPNAAAIYAAFNRHNIACPPVPACPSENLNHTFCPSLAAPTITGITGQACRITLQWSAVTGALEYRIFRNQLGADRGFMIYATVTSSVTSYTDARTAPGQTYYYAVQAVTANPSCTGPLSAVQSASASDCAACPIPAPPTGQGCAPASGAVNVSWTGTGTGDGYRVYRRKEGEYNWTLASPDLGTLTNFTDSNVVCDQSYEYKVVSYANAGGPCESDMPAASTGYCTTSACCTPPFAPTIQSSSATCDDITITWTPGAGSTQSFNVYRKRTADSGGYSRIAGVYKSLSYTDRTAWPGVEYSYMVRGSCDTNGFRESADSNVLSAMTDAPARVSGVQAERSCNTINVTWEPANNAVSYTVFRTTEDNCRDGFVEQMTQTGTSYLDTGVFVGTTYYYMVQANSASCGSSRASYCAVNAILGTVEKPKASDVSCTTLHVSWKEVRGGEKYDLYRADGECGPGTLIASDLTKDALYFDDSGLTLGTQYSYYVIARNDTCGLTTQSECLTLETLGIPAAPEAPTYSDWTCNTVRINWSPIDGAAGYDVYYHNPGCDTGIRIASDLTATYFDQDGLAPWNISGYYVIAKNDCGTATGLCSTFTAAPAPPGAPTFSNVGSTALTLNWDAADRATNYDLYRKTGSCGTGTLIAEDLVGRNYSDAFLDCETTYGYYLVAKNSCASSDPGSCATVTTLGPPSSPGNPTFSNQTNTTIDVQWNAVSRATSYTLYRRLGSCGTGAVIAGGITSTSYRDTDLLCNQSYGYYITANNVCGASAPGECSLTSTTNILPGTPQAPTYSDIDCTSAMVAWKSVPGATGYDLRRKQGTCDTGGLVTENYPSTAYPDSGLQAGTPYSYYVVARNACGYSSDGGCSSMTTLDDPARPTLPGTTPFCDKINIHWSESAGATAYKIFRTENSDCATGLIQVQIASSTTWDDTTASLGVTYYYKVKAHNNCGDSEYSLCVSGRRLDPPAQVTGLTASPICYAVRLTWTDIANVSYVVYRTETLDCGAGLALIGTTEDNAFNDSTAVLGTTYYYKVAATNTCGEGTLSACVSGASLTAPAAPAAPTYTNVNCQNLTVNWAPVPTALAYDIYRIVGDCGTTTPYVTNWSQTSFMDTFLASNTKYSYYIVAKNSCYSSDPGACSSVTTRDLPGNPSNLAQTADCPATTLQWTGSAGADTYYVWRTVNPDCSTNLGLQGSPTETTFTDTSAAAGFTYYYKIQAYNTCGTSLGYSNCLPAVRGSTPSPPTTVTPTPQCGSIDLTWPAPPGAVSYIIWRSPDSNCTTGLEQIGTSGTPSFSDTSAALGTLYYYRVQSVNLCGTSVVSTCSIGEERLTPPSPPNPPTFTTVTCDSITLTWNTVAGSTGYDVYRRLDDCGTGSVIASNIAETSYTDEDLIQGTTYAYYVVAKNACGDSTPGACRTMVPGPPTAPAGLTVTGNCTDIQLRWNEVAGATSYEIWRTTNANCIDDFVFIGTATGMPDYLDDTASLGVTYRYVVKAVNACSTSGGSACVSGARRSAPAKPVNFTATGTCLGNMLAWDPVPDAEFYVLHRGDSCGNPVDTFTGVTSPYSDTTALEGITYSYWVQAGNFCGGSPVSDCASSQRLPLPVPTLSGPAMNTCPDLTVSLGTEAGQSDYQWYKSGTPIPGATTASYEASESDVYTVSYRAANGCMGTSGPRSIMVYVCGPPVIDYQSYADLQQTTGGGDGDGILEAGEKWQVTVTVTNTGERHASTVEGSLYGMGVFVCNNPGSFGSVIVGGTGSFTFEFIPDPSVWYGANACGSNQVFSLTDKSSEGGAYAYADDTDVIGFPVGSTGAPVGEYSNQANALDALDAIVTSPFNPPLTGPGGDAVSASVTWMAFGDTDMTACAVLRLRAPGGTDETVLKAAGQADPMYADILAFYRAHGPGSYTLVLEELADCGGTGTAHAVAGTLSVQTDPGCSIGSAACAQAQEVSNDPGHLLKASRNGDSVDLQFEDVGATHYQIYVSTSPATDPFADGLPDGRMDCDFTGWASGPEGMMTLGDYDLQGDIPGTPAALYFLITADNGPGSEGPLGFRTGGAERTAQAYCRR